MRQMAGDRRPHTKFHPRWRRPRLAVRPAAPSPRHTLSITVTACAVAALAAAAVAGAADTYAPALPEAGKVPLSEVVQRPRSVRWANGTASVNCQVLVDRRGRAKGTKCGLADGGRGSTAQSVLGATYAGMRRARFRPASVDGEAVDVVMSVRVTVRCIGDDCDVSTYPNLGLYTREHGSGYVAPQEILVDGDTWYERLLDRDVCGGEGRRLRDACVDEGAYRLVMYADVTASGQPGNVRYRENPLRADGEGLIDEAADALASTRFIPGLVAGEPRALTVLSSSLHHDNNRRIPKTVCVEQEQLGSRIARRTCYNPQQHARIRPGLQIYSWLPLTTGAGGLTSSGT